MILQSWNRSKENEELNPMIPGSMKNISDENLKEAIKKNEVFRLAQPVFKRAVQEVSQIIT